MLCSVANTSCFLKGVLASDDHDCGVKVKLMEWGDTLFELRLQLMAIQVLIRGFG